MSEKILELLEEQKTAFHEFKQENDARLGELAKKGEVDTLLETKVEKINDEISRIDSLIKEFEKRQARKGLGGGEKSEDVVEHEKAFFDFIRKGKEEGLAELQQKALNVTTDADGGYAVPEQLDRNILKVMKDESPMRQECKVVSVGGATYKQLFDLGGAASGWVDEDDARAETDSPTLASVTPFMGEIYANPSATQTMLDDVFFKADEWLIESCAEKFTEEEADSFVNGTGTKKPKGFLQYTSVTTADSSRTFGQLQHKVAAAANAFTSDELLDLVYMLRKKYRNGAVWMMNGTSLSSVRKLKDGNGNYVWQPSVQAGQPSTLHGYRVAENEDMPDVSTGVVGIAFGNFKRGYTIVDRMGIRTLRDPYTNKPYVHFYSTKRVGGMVTDSLAIKLLKQA